MRRPRTPTRCHRSAHRASASAAAAVAEVANKMQNPTPRRPSPTRPLAAIARPAIALGLAWLAPALAGCQTAAPWANAEKKQVAANAAAAVPPKADEAVSQTDFRKDVTQDQQINVHLQIGRVYESQQQYEA